MSSSESLSSEDLADVRHRSRRWLFRVLAVGLVLAGFASFEVVCHLAGWGRPVEHEDPFVGFDEVQPLFVAEPEAGEYRIAPARRRFFADEAFPLEKGPRTRRVFVLGGSTVQGRPYSIETSFAEFLELSLIAADDTWDWEVVNCGGISYASYRLVPILDEVLTYEPDLVIVCTGHNEFLEDRTYGHLRDTPGVVKSLSRLRSVVLLRRLLGRSRRPRSDGTTGRPLLPAETDPILDYRNGLRVYHRDDAWHEGVVAHFEFALRRMVESARAADVPLMFVRPPSNLRDTLPFKSEHPDEMTRAERDQFRRLLDEARASYAVDPAEGERLLLEALLLDDGYAAAWYELGELRERLGRSIEAREAYVAARDNDVCPLRMISPLERAMSHVAEETDTPLFDAFGLLERDCTEGILDSSQLVDHVHPSIDGHRRIADGLVAFLAERGDLEPTSGWRTRAAEVHRAHLDSLDELYFLHGERTLEAVRGWTKGQADGPDASTRFPGR